MFYFDYGQEKAFLSQYAQFSGETKGRQRFVPPSPYRTEYQRDRDRIIHSKAFRRLKHKTQVFVSPEGDHFRTRLTHTLEVSQIARTVARALRLNEDLVEAIAMGHDLGHTPFGHLGERILDRLAPPFRHNEQSLRVVDLLEENGEGLNLTFEVRDGILNHRMKSSPATLEGKVVSYADRIAYVNHDIDDAERAGILSEDSLPAEATALLGNKKGVRIDRLVGNLVENCAGKSFVRMTEEFEEAFGVLLKFMHNSVYNTSIDKEQEKTCTVIIETLFEYYKSNPSEMPEFYQSLLNSYSPERVVCDYISGMTDNKAENIFRNIKKS